jgi:hypothetical protein
MYATRILKDSIAPSGKRLTTWELQYPRFVHAELMTHRLFCLAGDTQLEFDLPGGQREARRVYRMRLDEYVDKWTNGARRVGTKPKTTFDLSWIVDTCEYDAPTVAAHLGMASASNIHAFCRSGVLPATKVGRTWLVRGADIRTWRLSAPEQNRFDMRARLQEMRIRQFNERTGDVQTAHVVDAVFSGVKAVHTVRAGAFEVTGSLDHRVLTDTGWKTIGQLTPVDYLVVRRFGKRDDERLDPLRLKKIDGRWRSTWQRQERARLQSEDVQCRRCAVRTGTVIHHIVPVYLDPTRAFDPANITLLCDTCHFEQHDVQDWQGGTYLYGALAKVDEVVYRGDEPTFDLSISGDDANFLANGVVVHNSRNAASSRAIPIEKLIERVEQDPAMPLFWGKNQKGMQAEVEMTPEERALAEARWLHARDLAVEQCRHLAALGLHKQLANRIIEPWMFITVILSATEFDNWFHLRNHRMAQPEIAWVARDMWRQYHAPLRAPQMLDEGQWHLPLIDGDETAGLDVETLKKISTGRCARVSYLNHEGQRDITHDIALHDRLSAGPAVGEPGHWSPFEHIAQALATPTHSGNFIGWKQYRKEFEAEHYTGKTPVKR